MSVVVGVAFACLTGSSARLFLPTLSQPLNREFSARGTVLNQIMRPHFRCLLLFAFLCISTFSSAFPQEEKEESGKDKTLSWYATGPTKADFRAQNSDLALTMNGMHNEITFWQDRGFDSGLLDGLHLLSLSFQGEGTDSSGNDHVVEYRNLSFAYSLGYDLRLGLAHLQPYAAFGLGMDYHNATHTSASGKITPYEEKSEWGYQVYYGLNLILEVSGKLWLGYAINYFTDSLKIQYHDIKATITPRQSQTLMLVWNWERLHIETIDPNAAFFGF